MRAAVKEVSAGAANDLQQEIRLCAASTGQSPNAPLQAHTLPSNSRLGGKSQPLQTMPLLNVNPPTAPTGGQIANALVPNAQGLQCNSPSRAFVLLCVDAKRLKYLEHIDVTSLKNDQHMFKLIREAYIRVRDQHDWKVSMMLPKWLPFWAWIDTMSLLVPKSADYIKVSRTATPAYLTAGLSKDPRVASNATFAFGFRYSAYPISDCE